MRPNGSKEGNTANSLSKLLLDLAEHDTCSQSLLSTVRSLLGQDSTGRPTSKSKVIAKKATSKVIKAEANTLVGLDPLARCKTAMKVIKVCLKSLADYKTNSIGKEPNKRAALPTSRQGSVDVLAQSCSMAFEVWSEHAEAVKRQDICMTRSNYISRLQEHHMVRLAV